MGVTLFRLDAGERVTSVFPVVGRRPRAAERGDAGCRLSADACATAYRVGLYPGTFDPITNGHLDIIGRAARLLDRLVVGVAINTGKGPLFPIDERVELVQAETARRSPSAPAR